jgi:hypothetical protein
MEDIECMMEAVSSTHLGQNSIVWNTRYVLPADFALIDPTIIIVRVQRFPPRMRFFLVIPFMQKHIPVSLRILVARTFRLAHFFSPRHSVVETLKKHVFMGSQKSAMLLRISKNVSFTVFTRRDGKKELT